MGEGKSLLNYYPDSEADKVKYLGIKETFAKSTVSRAEDGWKTIMAACSTDKRLMYTEKTVNMRRKAWQDNGQNSPVVRFTKKIPLHEWKIVALTQVEQVSLKQHWDTISQLSFHLNYQIQKSDHILSIAVNYQTIIHY